MFRSVIFLVFQAITAIFVFLGGALIYPFVPYQTRYRFITSWSHMVMWAARKILKIQVFVEGLEHLKIPCGIILCKHQSAWETLFLQTILGPQAWVLKKALLSIPFFGWGLAMLEPIAIDRSKKSSIKQLLSQGKERLSQGRWVIIFPEGSRMSVGKKGHYSRSGAMLSKESGYPIIPIAHNAGVFWPKNAFRKRPGMVHVCIGEPIYPENFSLDEIHAQSVEWIENTMSTLNEK